MRFALPIKVLVFAVAAPLAMMALSLSGFQPLGMFGYLLFTVVAGVWNFTVIRHLWKNGPKMWQTYMLAGAMVPVFLCWTLFHPVLFKYSRGVLMATYFIALVLTAMVAMRVTRRNLRHYFVPIYNALGMVVIGIWLAQDGGSPIPAFVAPFGYASGVTQALNFYYLAIFMPFLFLPPMLLKFEDEESPPVLSARGRISILTLGWGVGKGVSALSAYFVGFMIIAAAVGAGNISSFSDENPDFTLQPGMKFAIVARSFTAVKSPATGWQEEVAREISSAKELGLDFLRYDVRSDLVESQEGIDALRNVSERVRVEGLGLMLGLYGRAGWPGTHPESFEAYREQITSDALAVCGFADYVLPYYEPNGQAELVLGRSPAPDEWAAAAETLAALVHNGSNAKVLIEIAMGPDALGLVDAIQTTGIDAIGFDIYPGNWNEMGEIGVCANAVDRSLVPEVWLSEFGMECSMFGEATQANFIGMAVAEASRLNLTGCCLWALEDDTGLGHPPMTTSHLGIVYSDWSRKPGYGAYADAITAIRP